jgi:Tfp pilus assembly protein PilE
MITSVEAFVLALMTAIVVAIAIPSYMTIRDRDSDSAARSHLRQAGEAAETYRTDNGSYAGMSPAALGRVDRELEASGYRVKSVREKTYCLETTVRGRTWHIVAPAGDLRRGGCP